MPHTGLTGTEWVLEGIVSGQTRPERLRASRQGARSTLRFTADNKLFAMLGCNGGGGNVTVTDSTLVVREFVQTVMLCGGAKQEVERAVGGVLGSDTEIGYVVDGQTLTLRAGPTGLIYRVS